MTTIIIDGKTKAIYTDSRGTKTNKQEAYRTNIFANSTVQSKTINHLSVGKCYYTNRSVGFVCATRDVPLFLECIKLSKLNGEFTLPELTKKNAANVIICNVKTKGNVIEVYEYKAQQKDRLFCTEYFFKVNEEIMKEGCTRFYGSGADFARGAYRMCHESIQAIVAASRLDMYTDDNVKTYSLDY
jgi:hypothetical protein